MPEEYYPDADGQSPMEGEPAETKGGKTTLIPKSLLKGKSFEPGDEIRLKIVHDYEGEYAAEFIGGESEDEETPEEEEAEHKLAGPEEFEEADKATEDED